jgi:hypothetical protein
MFMPKKLKNHILNFIRFVFVYFLVETVVETGRQFNFWEHYALIEFGVTSAYAAVASWFVWRFYTGMYRDCDFYTDD